MTDKLIEGLANAGALGIICGALIFYLGQKIDRLHSAIVRLAENHCKYDGK